MTARTVQLAWVLHHLDDLDADFARFYRVDWRTLDGPRFFSRAQRVTAYGGVMSLIVEEAQRPGGVPEAEEDDTLPPLPEGAVTVPESAWAGLTHR